MTLCIGALADGHTSVPKLVVCSDMLLGDELQTTATTNKTDVWFNDNLATLYAGPWEDTANLRRVLQRHVRAKPLTSENVRGILLEAWKEFDAIPRSAEPSPTDAQCLIAGFIDNEPRIIRMDASGVFSFPFHTSIGIGAYHADTILSWRNIQQYSSLEQVLYFVYEGRRFGELCRSVGGTTIMHILSLDENKKLQVNIVMAEGLNIMAGWFKRFGPQDVGYDLKFPPTSFSRVDSD